MQAQLGWDAVERGEVMTPDISELKASTIKLENFLDVLDRLRLPDSELGTVEFYIGENQ